MPKKYRGRLRQRGMGVVGFEFRQTVIAGGGGRLEGLSGQPCIVRGRGASMWYTENEEDAEAVGGERGLELSALREPQPRRGEHPPFQPTVSTTSYHQPPPLPPPPGERQLWAAEDRPGITLAWAPEP